jgi:hypothetical protein
VLVITQNRRMLQHLLYTIRVRILLRRMIRTRELGLNGIAVGFAAVASWKHGGGNAQCCAKSENVGQVNSITDWKANTKGRKLAKERISRSNEI